MNLYLGRPVILEPGSSTMSLSEAVKKMQDNAPRDGWMIRVSGDIRSNNNTLIPSTFDSVTNLSYNQRRRKLQQPMDAASDKEKRNTGLYTRQIAFGIVTADTWGVIQQLPEELREQYEQLQVDAFVFYPKELIADTPEDYDRIISQFQSGTNSLPWQETMEMESKLITKQVRINESCVALRIPINQFAAKLKELRAEAKREHGRKSGSEKILKLVSNSIYGILASDLYPIGNIVAANIITARARAAAYVMTMSLNGFQVITDGCTWRADQVPAGTLRDWLEANSDYTLHRPSKQL